MCFAVVNVQDISHFGNNPWSLFISFTVLRLLIDVNLAVKDPLIQQRVIPLRNMHN